MSILNRTTSFLTLFLLLFSSPLFADPNIYQKENFKFKAKIKIENSGAIQKIILPEVVQNKLFYQDGRDVRVYNAEDRQIPCIVKFDSNKIAPPVVKALAFYPLEIDSSEMKKTKKPSYSENVEIRVEVQVSASGFPEKSGDISPKSYIIENPNFLSKKPGAKIPGTLNQLDFEWKQFEGIADLRIETSSNLKHWRPVPTRGNIVDMNFMDQALIKKSLILSQKVNRYIKLTWTGSKRPQITKVVGTFGQKSLKPAYYWTKKIQLSPTDESKKSYSFEISPSLKANKFRLTLADSNQIYIGKITTQRGDEEYATPLTNFQFFRVDTKSGEISNTEKAIPRTHNKLWNIHFQYPENINTDKDISLHVNRYPLSLFFLKQGDGPFYLAYGNKSISSQPESFTRVVSEILKQTDFQFEAATLTNPEPVSPWQEPVEKPKTNWNKIVLWGILVCGVFLMLWMAKNLFMQISKEK